MSEEKTLITNAKDCAHFLGYDIFVSKSQDRKKDKNGHTRRTNSGKVKLYVSREKWQKKLMEYKALKIRYNEGREIFEPVHRTYLISNDDLEILQQYNSEIRGMYNYYRTVSNNDSNLFCNKHIHSDTPTSPKTGDNTRPIGFVLLTIVSFSMTVLLIIKKRKYERN